MKLLVNYWYNKNPLLFLLLPLSYLYQFFFLLHKLTYSLGFRKRFSSPKPVIVIGNITVGGTGKTPLTIALAKILSAHGYKPGIVSRGYKGKMKHYPGWVTNHSDPTLFGDEPVLIASQTNCPVVVAPKRADAIKTLLKNTDCDVILSDDGIQHHALKKDIQIVIVDGLRKFGNGWCLPAGPLREPIKKLSKVDFIVYNDNAPTHKYYLSQQPAEIYNLFDNQRKLTSSDYLNRTIYAVAAIGHPERFFNSLRKMGFTIETRSFPDHHQFIPEDFGFIKDNDLVIMTEKDAIKCQKIARRNLWVLPLKVEVNRGFIEDFLTKLRKHSSQCNGL